MNGLRQHSENRRRIGFVYRGVARSLSRAALSQLRRSTMTPEREHDELIDLGTASALTQGGFGPPIDDVQQLPTAGLSDD